MESKQQWATNWRIIRIWIDRNMTTAQQNLSKIILGIDPGTNVMGYGVIRVHGNKAEMVVMGVIDMRREKDVYLRLGKVFERVTSIIETYLPDEMAIEAPFFGKNIQSMLKLGRAQGVAIAAAIQRDVPIHEYAPLKIKMAITGKTKLRVCCNVCCTCKIAKCHNLWTQPMLWVLPIATFCSLIVLIQMLNTMDRGKILHLKTSRALVINNIKLYKK